MDPRRGQHGLLEASGGRLAASAAPGGHPGRSETGSCGALGGSWGRLGPLWAALRAVLWLPGPSPEPPEEAPGGQFGAFLRGQAQEAWKIIKFFNFQ